MCTGGVSSNLLFNSPVTSFARSTIIMRIESQDRSVRFRNAERLVTLTRNVVTDVYHSVFLSFAWEVFGQTVWHIFLIIAVLIRRFVSERLFVHATTIAHVILVTWNRNIVNTASDCGTNAFAHPWSISSRLRTFGSHDHVKIVCVNLFAFGHSRRVSEGDCLRYATTELNRCCTIVI